MIEEIKRKDNVLQGHKDHASKSVDGLP